MKGKVRRALDCSSSKIYYFCRRLIFHNHSRLHRLPFYAKTADASSQERLFIPSIGLAARVRDIERTGNQLIAPETAAGVYRPTNHKSVIIGHSILFLKTLKILTPKTVFTFDHKNISSKREILEPSI